MSPDRVRPRILSAGERCVLAVSPGAKLWITGRVNCEVQEFAEVTNSRGQLMPVRNTNLEFRGAPFDVTFHSEAFVVTSRLQNGVFTAVDLLSVRSYVEEASPLELGLKVRQPGLIEMLATGFVDCPGIRYSALDTDRHVLLLEREDGPEIFLPDQMTPGSSGFVLTATQAAAYFELFQNTPTSNNR